MKTYLLNISERVRLFNKVLDVKTVLCDKSWRILRDDGIKESYIFQQDGQVIVAHNGKASIGKYTFPAEDKILIEMGDERYLINPTFSQTKDILAFQLDGTSEYSFMINEKSELNITFPTFQALLDYWKQKEIEDLKRQEWELQQKIEDKRQQELKKERKMYIASLELNKLRPPYLKRFRIVGMLNLFLFFLGCILWGSSNTESTESEAIYIWGTVLISFSMIILVCLGCMYVTFIDKSNIQYMESLMKDLDENDEKYQWLKTEIVHIKDPLS
jgi:hypothetical protein